MDGLFQLGTLFGLRSPFRAKGLTLFVSGLCFYCRAAAALLFWLGFQDKRSELPMRFPIFGQFSWFFTAHTFLTLLTPILNGGIISLGKGAYRWVLIGIIVLVRRRDPPAFDLVGGGFNWQNAVCSYIFAGYFGVHGWPVSGIWTWIPFFVFGGISFYLASYDIFEMVSPRWHWAVLPYRLVIAPRGKSYRWLTKGWPVYVSPVSYCWATAALYAFRSLSLGPGVSKIIPFFGGKVFMIHWLDGMARSSTELTSLLRALERRETPLSASMNGLLVSVQALAIGSLMEMYRSRAFQFVLNIAESLWSQWGWTATPVNTPTVQESTSR
jgi:hypothetical protein